MKWFTSLVLCQLEKTTGNDTHNSIKTHKEKRMLSNAEKRDMRKLERPNVRWFGHRLFVKGAELFGVRFDLLTCPRKQTSE